MNHIHLKNLEKNKIIIQKYRKKEYKKRQINY